MTHALWPWAIFCASLELIYSTVLYLEQSGVSCWQRCLQSHKVSWHDNPGACILMWPKPYIHKEHVRPFQICLHLSHLGLFTSPSLNRCSLKRQYSVGNPVIIFSWFLLRLSNSPALFTEGFLRKPLSYLAHVRTANAPHVSYLSNPWSHPWQPLQIYQAQA